MFSGPRAFSESVFHWIASCGTSSLALGFHPSVFPSSLPLSYRRAPSTAPTLGRRLAEATRPYSMSKFLGPSTAPLTRCPGNIPGSPEVPPSGFGYPLDGVSSKNPWKPLSASNALGVPSPELYLFFRDRVSSFPEALPFVHFPKKPSRPSRCASRASSHRRSWVSHLLSGGLVRNETLGSPEVFGPTGFLLTQSRKRASPSSPSPHTLKNNPSFKEMCFGPQGLTT